MSDRTEQDAAPAALAASVLEEETRRQEAHGGREPVVLPDDMLPGVGSEPVSLRQALHENGVRTAGIVGLLSFIEVFDSTALAVLAPDIRSSLGISRGALGVIGGAFGILFFLGSVPISACSPIACPASSWPPARCRCGRSSWPSRVPSPTRCSCSWRACSRG